MRNLAILFSAAVFCLGTAASAQEDAGVRQPERVAADRVLTLEECVRMALDYQPSVRRAVAQVGVQEGQVAQSRSRLLPSVTVASGTELAPRSSDTQSSLSASASQLVYDFRKSPLLLSQAEGLRSASVFGLRGTQADVVLDVKQAYYRLLRSNALLRVYEENLKSREEHVLLAEARLAAGLAPKADVLKAQSGAASARYDLVAARNNAQQARVDLNIAIGLDPRSETMISEASEPPVSVLGLDQAVTKAFGSRPEVLQADVLVSATEDSLKSARTGNLPALTTSLSGFESWRRGLGASNSWEWMLNLQWKPFDSGLTRGAITQAEAQLVSSQESLYQTRQAVSRDVVSAQLDLASSQEALAAAEVEVLSAQQDLDSARGRYQDGVGILLEVMDAQAAFVKAQVDETSARYGLSIARAQVEHAVGATPIEGAQR